MIKVDLHVHTCYSSDSLTPLDTVIEACQYRGLGAVAITDHNVIQGAVALREKAPFPVIVGEEIMTNQGEIIGLFLSERIAKGLSPEEVIAAIREQGGVVYVPHPLDRLRRGPIALRALRSILDQVDALEVFNSRVLLPSDNDRARRLAEAHSIPGGAGSDAHTTREIGRAYVEMAMFDGPVDFLDKLGQGTIFGRLSGVGVNFASTFAKISKKLRR